MKRQIYFIFVLSFMFLLPVISSGQQGADADHLIPVIVTKEYSNGVIGCFYGGQNISLELLPYSFCYKGNELVDPSTFEVYDVIGAYAQKTGKVWPTVLVWSADSIAEAEELIPFLGEYERVPETPDFVDFKNVDAVKHLTANEISIDNSKVSIDGNYYHFASTQNGAIYFPGYNPEEVTKYSNNNVNIHYRMIKDYVPGRSITKYLPFAIGCDKNNVHEGYIMSFVDEPETLYFVDNNSSKALDDLTKFKPKDRARKLDTICNYTGDSIYIITKLVGFMNRDDISTESNIKWLSAKIDNNTGIADFCTDLPLSSYIPPPEGKDDEKDGVEEEADRINVEGEKIMCFFATNEIVEGEDDNEPSRSIARKLIAVLQGLDSVEYLSDYVEPLDFNSGGWSIGLEEADTECYLWQVYIDTDEAAEEIGILDFLYILD